MKKYFKGLQNQSGSAILMAMFSVFMVLVPIALFISDETRVEFISSSQKVNRLKAYYAAKAGIKISLLRILIYKKAIAAYGDALGENKSMLDPIWTFPFAWPPQLPETIGSVSKDQIMSTVEASSLDSQYLVTVQSEGSKLDINDLGSSSKGLAEATKQQVLQIFNSEMEADEDFEDKYQNFSFEELINNMVDWVDENQEGLNGGAESDPYRDELESEFMPPNQPFKTINEIKMVAEMDDTLFEVLKNKITVYGVKGINVNYAEKDLLMAIDPQIDEEVVGELLKRRSSPELGGLFKNEEDFVGYLGLDEATFNEHKIPLLFDAEYNFRIVSTGAFKNSTKEITVITYDFENLKERLITLLDKQEEEENPPPPDPNPPPGGTKPPEDPKAKTKKIKVPMGRPRVVYWEET